MAWKKLKPRKNGRRYKRFSSVQIKPRSLAGPTTAAVFSGGRLIPDSAKAGFDYRHRGTSLGLTEEEIIERIRAKGKLLEFFGMKPQGQTEEDEFWAYLAKNWMLRKTDGTEPRMAVLDKIEKLEILWQSEFRQRVHTWNYVKLPIAERTPAEGDYLRMYFEGTQFLFVEKDGDIFRRSLFYRGRENAMRDYGYKKIIWQHRVSDTPFAMSAVIPVPS